MKYFGKKNNILKMIIIGGFILLILALGFWLKDKKHKDLITEKTWQITEFIENIPAESNHEEFYFANNYVSIIINQDGRYISHIFDCQRGQEIDFMTLVTDKKAFMEKITQLLYLKYPSFIADVLKTNAKTNVYALKDNELIIYYYDYEITPQVEEELYLKVNYNEIKDYIKIPVSSNLQSTNEEGDKIDLNKKLIALTFDDGPSKYTKDLVDILAKNHAQATFFMLGNKLETYQDTVKYIYAHNHDIGYHSWAHQNLKNQEIEEIQAELQKSNTFLNKLIGQDFKFMRPPYGAINDTIKKAIDMPFILWNVDTEDWRYRDSEYLKNYVLDHLDEGNIILFHDTYKTSIEAIELILPELYVRGYQVVSVSTLADSFAQTLNNHVSYRKFSK